MNCALALFGFDMIHRENGGIPKKNAHYTRCIIVLIIEGAPIPKVP